MHKTSTLLLFVIVVIWIVSANSSLVHAQTCCTGGAPLTGALKLGGTTDGQTQIVLTYDNNNIQDFVLETDNLDNDYLFRKTESLVLQANYGLGKHLELTLSIPYLWLTEKNDFNQSAYTASSLGDLLLLGHYRFLLSENKNSLLLGAGIKMPSGNTQLKFEDTILLPTTLQPGSGSWDFIASAMYQQNFSFRPSLLFRAQMSYTFNTTSKKFTFHDTYKFGNEFLAFTGFSDQFSVLNQVLSPSLFLNVSHLGSNVSDGFENENTGGIWVNIAPGVAWNITKPITLEINYEHPLYRNVVGFQLTTTNKWRVALSILW